MNVLVATARSRLLARVRSADLKVTRSDILAIHGGLRSLWGDLLDSGTRNMTVR
jgi:hypothetical protein